MGLLNLALKTLNADGSTTIFGTQGNAVEDLVAGSATTIFATPPASAVVPSTPIWYAPAVTDQYFQNILDDPDLFETIGDVKVFKMYLSLNWPDATLKAFFAYLAANDIKLGVEAPPLVADAGSPGFGIESFASTGDMIAAITRIQALGGTISYVAWDEPLYFGSNSTGIYTVAQLASQVAAASAAVRAIFPNVQIGDIEPVDEAMDSPASLQAWFAAYAAASGTPFTSFLADINTGRLGWQSNLASTIAVAKADGIPVGTVIIGLGAASTDTAWSATAVANALQMLSDPALRTDYLDVQSWQINPSENSDPGVAGTLASVAADIANGETAALAVPAAAHYTAAGLLQSVTWSGGWTASEDGARLVFASPSGTIVGQYAWSDVRVFAFDPGSATVSLTVSSPSDQPDSAIVSVTDGGFVFAPDAVPGSVLTLTLAPSSTTGFVGSGVTNRLTPTIVGTAVPGSTIQLQIDGSGAGTAVASADGAWTFTVTDPLTTGAHLIEASGADNQQSLTVVSIDPTQRLTPTLGLAPGSDTGFPGDGITDDARPTFAGVDDSNVEISVSIDGALVGTTATDADGNWSYTPESPLARGTHTVTASAAGPPGTSSAPATIQLTIDTAAQEAAAIGPDPLFDAAWYLQQHPGIAASATAAYEQYITVGWKEGYDPSPFFSTSYYLTQNPDVAAAGVNPLLHFETYGWQEDRNPSAGFDTAGYEAANPGLPAGEDPLVAYISSLTIADAPAAASTAFAIVGATSQTIVLPTGGTTILGAGGVLIIAASNTLTGADSIDGGAALLLAGGGKFDLTAPAVLRNIQSVWAQEGQGATAQTVILRAGLNLAVNVASDDGGDLAPGITIIGAANDDVINLGSGNDQVTLGVGETVNGGGGNDTITVTSSSETIHGGSGNNIIIITKSGLEAQIYAGSGFNTLVINGGGAAVMGDGITGISDVRLATATAFTANGSANLRIVGSSGGGDTVTLGAASQRVTSGGAGEHVFVTAPNAGAQVSGVGIGSQLEITTGGTAILNPATGGSQGDPLTVKLDAASNLTLSPVQFIHAVGSDGNDTITAGATHQTLSGGGGTDTLIGAAGGYDIFRDSAAGLGGDMIREFLPTDQIDLMDLNPNGATLIATASQGNTTVIIASGATKMSFLMAGSFDQAGFTLAGDGAGGTIVAHS